MVTNEERREVARNIRNADLTKYASYYEEVKGWDHVRATRFVLVSNLGSAIGIEKAIFSIDDLKIRLADLIEPEPERTCKWSRGCGYDTGCGNNYLDSLLPKFCPYCGGKVEAME